MVIIDGWRLILIGIRCSSKEIKGITIGSFISFILNWGWLRIAAEAYEIQIHNIHVACRFLCYFSSRWLYDFNLLRLWLFFWWFYQLHAESIERFLALLCFLLVHLA